MLSINIYYMGRWKLNAGIFKRLWLVCYNDIRAFCGGHWYALKPLYVDRMVLLLVRLAYILYFYFKAKLFIAST